MALTPRKINEAGHTENLEACATGGDEFSNSGIEFIHVVNDHASQSYTITVTAQTTSVKHPNYGTLTKANQSLACAAGAEIFMGPFKQSAFNDADNKVQITYLTSGGAALSTVGDAATH